MAFGQFKARFGRSGRELAPNAPLAGDRRQSIQRLQVGFSGLLAMILIVGLANVIMDSAQESQATAVPEAAPTVVPEAAPIPAPARDPLADAGVVPDLPADPDADDDAAGQSGAARPPVQTPPGDGATPPRP